MPHLLAPESIQESKNIRTTSQFITIRNNS
jgi:hypothetical protein